ncbi:MAG: putative glycosyltransferase [Algoriphagus marincola HL-49]|uniref:Putative glycosyltransferase n=1 Tax=Algoriphagus marincola HL-49 TaxID=1305737 RepID=A0A0N8KHD8_9BACT|nr:MAG: putative glycosyltransferase [Algoriphagus marincola HL-49]
MRFGGFIITYNRPELLIQTINSVFQQTFPPELLWIIDNSDNVDTEFRFKNFEDKRVRYFRMGYNAGPAGGAKKGLELCTRDGLDWIYWGDDNDPPKSLDTFEKLQIHFEKEKIGVIGEVGQYFSFERAKVVRVKDFELKNKELIEVDFIAGGMSMMVSSAVIKSGVLPDSSFFFGFEELDFCLNAKKKGFKVYADSHMFFERRKAKNYLGIKKPFYKNRFLRRLRREYYSLRNLLFLALKHKSYRMILILHFKWLVKGVFGFKNGIEYGMLNLKLISKAFFHFYTGKSGYSIKL